MAAKDQDSTPQTGQLLDDAKESAKAQFNEQKDAAADGLQRVAAAMRDASTVRRDGRPDREAEGDALHGWTDAVADGVDRFSTALRKKDFGVAVRDMEAFARSQPVAFFSLALATGFVAVRFMKAHSSQGS